MTEGFQQGIVNQQSSARDGTRAGKRRRRIGVKRSWPPLLAAIALSAAGVWVSGQLLGKHMGVPGGASWLEAFCESERDAGISCDRVLSSRWGVFPPGDPNDPGRLPLAFIGVAYFTILLTWFAAVGRPSHASRKWHLLPLGLNAVGLGGSVGLIIVMGTRLNIWCPLCLVTHLINGALLVTNLLLRPRPPEPPQLPDEAIPPVQDQTNPPPPSPVHPTFRLAAVTIVLALTLTRLEFQVATGATRAGLERQNKRLRATVAEIQKSDEALVAMFWNNKKQEIAIRDDDPIRFDAPHLPRMVLWSDFQCAHCMRFAVRFESEYYKQFDGYLRIVFKHYPLCKDCNRYVGKRTHPHACRIAALAEAVRIHGGNTKFWEFHDLLFDNQKTIADIDAGWAADRLELDADQLLATAESEQVLERIKEDIKEGKRVGVKGTPAVFLSGRQVSSLSRNVSGFWKKMGASYQKIRAKRAREKKLK